MPDLDPDLLRAFVTVARELSFTRAAAALNRTQSAISMQIARLEERLDVALFDRSRGRVALTAAGEGLLVYAHRILVLNEEAAGRVRQHQTEGIVRLGAMDDYGAVVLPPLLARFANAHPRIQVEMETGLTQAMIARVGVDLDLLVAMHPEGEGAGDLLCRERAVWAAGPYHEAAGQAVLPVALYPRGCLFRQWAMAALEAAQRPWRLAFVSHSLAAVAAIAAEGLAVTVVKTGTFPPGLRALGEDDGLPSLPRADIRLHRAPGLSAAGAVLADHLSSCLAMPRPEPGRANVA